MTMNCLACNVPLVPGTSFCGTCGTPAGQGPAVGLAAPPMPLPPSFGGGRIATAMIAADPARSAAAIAQVLQEGGISVTGSEPARVAFIATRRSLRSLFMTVRYRGVADVQPSPGGTMASLRVKLEPASAIVPALVIPAIVLVLNLIGNGGRLATEEPGMDAAYQSGKWFGVLVFLAVLGLVPYLLMARGGAQKVANRIAERLRLAVGGGAAAVSPVGAAGVPVAEQLRTLAALHRGGDLSEHEYAQARAALLATL